MILINETILLYCLMSIVCALTSHRNSSHRNDASTVNVQCESTAQI